MYKTDKLGLSILMSTLPIKGAQEFYNNEFKKGLYQDYKFRANQAIKTYKKGISNEALHDDLYKPIGFILLGRYDCLILSLVEHTNFNVRSMLPYHSANAKNKSSKSRKFDYQIMTGLFPYNNMKIKEKTSSLLARSKSSFLELAQSNVPKNNLIAMCQLKLNSVLLIGNGGKLSFKVVNYLNSKLKELCNNHTSSASFLVLENYGYSELIVLIFSNDLKFINETCLDLRETRFQDFTDFYLLSAENKSSAANKKSDLDDYKKELEENSLLRRIKPDSNVLDQNHMFEKTVTEIGVNMDMIFPQTNAASYESNSIKKALEKNFIEKISIDITTKPGHIYKVYDTIVKYHDIDKIELAYHTGKSDIQIVSKAEVGLVKLFTDLYVNIIQKCSEDIVDVTTTTFNFFNEQTIKKLRTRDFNRKWHIDIYDVLSRDLIIDDGTILRIKHSLSNAGISHVCTQRVLTILSNFNNSISDPLLFSLFLELHSFLYNNIILKTIFHTIESKQSNVYISELSGKSLENLLSKQADIFEAAFYNRYFHSSVTSYITNYNFLHKGSIQNILFSAEIIYRMSLSIMSPVSSNDGIIHLSGKNDTVGYSNALRANYFHIFSGELLMSCSDHEAANNFAERMIRYKYSEDKIDLDKLPCRKLSDNCHNKLEKLVIECGIIDLFEFPEYLSIEDAVPDKFVYHKKNQLFSDYFDKPNFDYHKSIHWKKLWRYVLVDLLTYKLGYFSDFNLFNFWHWIHFLQASQHYIDFDTVDPGMMRALLLRMEIIKKIAKVESTTQSFTPFLDQSFCENYNTIQVIVERLFEHRDDNPFTDLFADFTMIVDNWFEISFENVKEEITKINRSYCTMFINDFQNGTIHTGLLELNNKENILINFERAKISYLYLIMDMIKINGNDGNYDLVLNRDVYTGKPLINNTITPSTLCADPRGGLFAIGVESREKYWQLRMTVQKYFWHMGLILKKDFYDQAIDRNKKLRELK